MKLLGKLIPWILTLVILIVLLVWIFSSRAPQVQESEGISDGIAYMDTLAQRDPSHVTQILRQREEDRKNAMKEEELEAQRQELIKKIENGDVDIWSMFEDYVILGDSRAVGFYVFDFLDKSRVLADGGHTIRDIEPQLDKIKALQPKNIYLCYGLNDVSIGYWDTSDEYVTEMMERIAMLQQEVPGAQVIVSSILPARDPAFEVSSRWRYIPDFSAAVEAACREAGVPFANNDTICAEYANYWQPDGIHVRPEFYSYWATNLILATIEGETDETETNTP